MRILTKKLLPLILAIGMIANIIIIPNASAAESGKCGDNISWQWKNFDLYLTGSGNMWDNPGGSSGRYYTYIDDCPYGFYNIYVGSGIKSIGEYAFGLYAQHITSVSLPSSITQIKQRAFEYCPNLTSISLPTNNFYYIGDGAFARGGLETISIPSSVWYVGKECFYLCRNLKSISLSSVSTIYESTFSGCNSLQSISIPDSVTDIRDSAFSDCSSLRNITIPKNVTSLGKWVFSGCTALQNIYVSEYNKNFISDNGVLLSKDKSMLYDFPGGRTGTYIVP